MKVKVGDKLPDAKVFLLEKDPKEVSVKKIINGEKTILFGLPGAFTPTCSEKHLPSFINASKEIKKNGIKKVICISINDPYVMDAWGEANNVGRNITMLADPYLSFTKSIGAEIDRNSKGMGIRSSRYAMIIENLEVKNIQEEKETKTCGISSAEGILDLI